jgi:hypothetical protein
MHPVVYIYFNIHTYTGSEDLTAIMKFYLLKYNAL